MRKDGTTEEVDEAGESTAGADGTLEQGDEGETLTDEERAAAEAEATTEGDAGKAGDPAGTAGADNGKPGKVEFSAEQQAVFEERLGKEIAKTRTATTELEQVRKTLSEREQALATATANLEAHIPVHPDWVKPDEMTLIRKANELEAEVERLAAHWDGIEDEDPSKKMSAQQVQQRHATATAQLAAIRDRADTAWKTGHRQLIEDAKYGRRIRERIAAAKASAGKDADKGKGGASAAAAARGSAAPGGAPLRSGGTIDRTKLPAAGKRTVADLMNAME